MGRLRVNGMLVLAVVAALHLWLLLLLQGALRSPPPRTAPAPAPSVLVRMLPPRAAAPTVSEVPPEPPRPPARRMARPVLRPAVPAEAPAAPAAASASTPAVAATPPAPASAPPGGLLDTEATRRAIREAARQPSIGEMGAAATGAPAPLSAQDRMGQEIARGARGDCLKGEYAGAGMGLLSLPFWLMAEMGDKCRR